MPSRPAIVVLGEGGACSGSIVADSVLLPSARRDGRIKVVCATIAFGMGGPPNHTALAPFTPLHPFATAGSRSCSALCSRSVQWGERNGSEAAAEGQREERWHAMKGQCGQWNKQHKGSGAVGRQRKWQWVGQGQRHGQWAGQR